ncbi:MAG: branched-chain amino acid ABC transporter permease [Gammaproteobacteria bacterium 39-13]|nr:high-affinity branched-chain amino acid ABC transporter permease LivM [Gammaproteobacteria bacterium]OJV87906.1 MAG: branched-chain amino acid ABC transporter permease [Gammaproteobacteria bacterium 39-13]
MKKYMQGLKEACLTTFIAILLLGPIISLVLDGFEIHMIAQRTLVLAVVIFFGKLIIYSIQQSDWGQRFKNKPKPDIRVIKGTSHRWWMIAFIISGFILPLLLNKYWLTVAILALIYILLGLGLNIVVGLAGLLNLGFVAFYAIGAYSYALGATYFDLGFWAALPIGALLAGLFGALLGFPVLRMHGDYLAIVTLGFGEIIRLILNNWSDVTGGPNGLSAPFATFFGLTFSRNSVKGHTTFHDFFNLAYDGKYRYLFTYAVLFIAVCLILRLVTRLQRMPLGRAWEALREDEIASRSLGINHVTTKLSAFSLGAMIGGIAGVFFAALEGFVNPTSFTFTESALILAIVVLGGMGSPLGVTIAAILFTLLPEMLRQFSEYRMLVFGGLMVLVMIWRPRGLIGMTRQWIVREQK